MFLLGGSSIRSQASRLFQCSQFPTSLTLLGPSAVAVNYFTRGHANSKARRSQRNRQERQELKEFLRRQRRRRILDGQDPIPIYEMPMDETGEILVKHWEPPVLQSWVMNWNKQRVGIIPLPYEVFGEPIRKDIVHRVVKWQFSLRRAGTAKTKSRSEVAGSTRKIAPQKGRGRARVGPRNPPHHRGGGDAFPKRPGSRAQGLQKKVRQMGLRIALSAKYMEGRLIILDSMEIESHKTQQFLDTLSAWDPRNVLLVHGNRQFDPNVALAGRSLSYFNMIPARGLTVYELIRTDLVFVTLEALEQLISRSTHISAAERNRITFPGLEELPEGAELADLPLPSRPAPHTAEVQQQQAAAAAM
eukprot:g3707.t1